MAVDGNGRLIEDLTAGNRPLVHSQKEVNAQRNTPQGRSSHSSIETSASTNESSQAFDVEWISYIVNTGTADIIFNFDASTTLAGKFTLGPGESISDLPRKATTLFYKSVAGTVSFKAMGVK